MIVLSILISLAAIVFIIKNNVLWAATLPFCVLALVPVANLVILLSYIGETIDEIEFNNEQKNKK